MYFWELVEAENEPLRGQLKKMFAGFPMNASATLVRCASGVDIVRQDDPCHAVHILIEGRIVVSGNQPGYATFIYSEFDALEIFGEYETFCGMERFLAEVRTKTRCRFITVTPESYFAWLLSDTHTMLTRARSVLNGLIGQANRERSFLFTDSTCRMMHFLVRWYEKNAGAGTARVPMTRAAIGEDTGVCLRTVNRNVRTLAEQGFLELQNGKISFTNKQYIRLKKELETRML